MYKKTSLLKIGIILIIVSYMFLVPTFLFIALGIKNKARLWGCLAGASYVVSWILFIAGFMVAGSDAVKLCRLWIINLFKRKIKNDKQTDILTKKN